LIRFALNNSAELTEINVADDVRTRQVPGR
jgi:hypothetical protein